MTKELEGQLRFDPLQDMMDTQAKFQKQLGFNFPGMTLGEITKYFKEMMIWMDDEAHEVLYELPGKPWKDYSGMTEEEERVALDKARKEFVDLWHFILNMALVLGFSADELEEAYFMKHQENKDRQVKGYDHKTFYREGR